MMKIYIQLLFMLGLFFSPSILCAGQFKITHIYDGDTVAIESHHLKIKVRLAGIDSPEISKNRKDISQQYSQQAKRYLSDLVLNKSANLKRYGRSSDGYILAVIYTGTKNINLEMVKAGLARIDKRNIPKDFDLTQYIKAEIDARNAGLGMWSRGERRTGIGEE